MCFSSEALSGSVASTSTTRPNRGEQYTQQQAERGRADTPLAVLLLTLLLQNRNDSPRVVEATDNSTAAEKKLSA